MVMKKKNNDKDKVKTKKPGYVKPPKKIDPDYDRWDRGGEGVVPCTKKG